MKFSTVSFSISFVFVILPFSKHVSADSVPHLSRRADGNNNHDRDHCDSLALAQADSESDPQTSLTLDSAVIASGFAKSGQNATDEVASLTSHNNFINFCLTVPNQKITNGLQIDAGSCNPAPMGSIPSSAKMPSTKFTNPKNGDTIRANTPFTISMAINNLDTGNFVNADTNFLSAPQQLNQQGLIIGHSHVVIEVLTALDQTTLNDPTKFVLFQGLNDAARGGVLTANATGLPPGAYRLCSMTTAANHQPVLVPIAQHGSLNDCIYFTASASTGSDRGVSTHPKSSAGGAPTSSVGSATTVTHPNSSAGHATTHPNSSAGHATTHPNSSAGHATTHPNSSAGHATTHPNSSAGHATTHPNSSPSTASSTGGLQISAAASALAAITVSGTPTDTGSSTAASTGIITGTVSASSSSTAAATANTTATDNVPNVATSTNTFSADATSSTAAAITDTATDTSQSSVTATAIPVTSTTSGPGSGREPNEPGLG